MPFKAKLRKIGNSVGVILPRDVITCYNVGDEIELNVITKDSSTADVITTIAVVTPVESTNICQYCGQPADEPSLQCNRHGVA